MLVITISTSLIFVFLALFIKHKGNLDKPIAEKGVLDLRDWNFKEDGIIELRGEWEVYDQKLLNPQSFSDKHLLEPDSFYTLSGVVDDYQQKENYFSANDYFTSRLNFRLEEGTARKLSLKFPHFFETFFKVWVNGELILGEEMMGQSIIETGPGRIIEIVDLQPEQSGLEIIVQYTNRYNYNKPLRDTILLGRIDQMYRQRESGLILDTLLISTLLFISLYYLGIFIFRYQDSAILYFSLFCLIINLRFICTGEAFFVDYFNLTYPIVHKILLSYYLAVPLFLSYLANLYPQEFSKKILVTSQISGIALYILTLIAPLQMNFFTLPYKIIVFFFVIYSIYSIALAYRKKREGSLLFLISLTFLFIIVVNDILYSNRLINTGYYLRQGIFIFVLAQSFIVFRRLTEKFIQTESMAQKLQETRARLAKIDKFKEQFIVSTSREIKLPLNNIITAIQSVIVNSEISLQKKTRNKFASIINMGKGLNYILDSFITYGRSKQGQDVTTKENLEVYQTIDYIIEILKPLMANEEIIFKNEIEPRKFMVLASRSQLVQIFYHFLENLSSLEEKRVTFKANKMGSKIKISLEIKGPNIRFRQQSSKEDSIFEKKFVDGKSDLKENIILQLIKLQGGNLEIKKWPNKLLAISIILPGSEYNSSYDLERVSSEISAASEEIENKKEAKLPSHQCKSILIVSDKDNKINPLKGILKRKDYYIRVIDNKKRIMEELNGDFSLVILDLLVFDKSALELCREIRGQFKLLELPILIMVARSSPENLIKGFELGINDLIKEPFEINELKARVRTLITLKDKVEESIAREQDFLRAQIKPHFLYNTLDTIAYLAKHNPDEAEDLILNLANYLRYSFDFENLNMSVPIKKELELVDFYITIQQKRFGDRVEVVYNIEKGLSFEIPPLILQPIIENSIKHGILKKKKGGTVEINIKSIEEFFVITIIDDGVGMSEEELANLLKEGESYNGGEKHGRRQVGLDNINQRLKKLHNQKLKIESRKGVGTTVEFKIKRRGQ